MSIASEIEIYRTNLGNAYTACMDKESETIPENKNLVNLEAAIRGIPSGLALNNAALTEVVAAEDLQKGDLVTLQDEYSFGEISTVLVDSPTAYPHTTGCFLTDTDLFVTWYGQDSTPSYYLYAQVFKWNGTTFIPEGSKTVISTLNARPSYNRHLKVKKVSESRVVILSTYSNTKTKSPMYFTVDISGIGTVHTYVLSVVYSNATLSLSKGNAADIWIEASTDTTAWLFYNDNVSVYGVPMPITSAGTTGTATFITDLIPNQNIGDIRIMRYDINSDGITGAWYLFSTYDNDLYGITLEGLDSNGASTLELSSQGLQWVCSGVEYQEIESWLETPGIAGNFGTSYYHWISKAEGGSRRDLRFIQALFQSSDGWVKRERPVITNEGYGGTYNNYLNNVGISYYNGTDKIFFLHNNELDAAYAQLYQLSTFSDTYFTYSNLIETTQVLGAFAAVGNVNATYSSHIGYCGSVLDDCAIAIYGEGIKIFPIISPTNQVAKITSANQKIYGVASADCAAGETAQIYIGRDELSLPPIE